MLYPERTRDATVRHCDTNDYKNDPKGPFTIVTTPSTIAMQAQSVSPTANNVRSDSASSTPWEKQGGIAAMDSTISRSILLFLLAGLCEIGGGYLVWLWLREGRAFWIGAIGGLILFLYGVLPTHQPKDVSFGRVYAAYGGVFVALSLLWGWWIDGSRPDRWDLLGGAIALCGVAIIMYAPRG